jgi:RNA polymerase sigma-70 factor, ECF subfamily
VPGSEDLEAAAFLMQQIAEGDARAYRALVDAHLGAILVYAQRLLGSREEAEEVAQETFLRAWQHAESYRPESRVSTWLHTIAHNLAVDRLRKKRPLAASDALEEVPGSARPPSVLLERKETVLAVQAALERLPERQRAALTLTHHQGLSHAEAALVLGVGVDAVESLVARARRNLRELLAPLGSGTKGNIEP